MKFSEFMVFLVKSAMVVAVMYFLCDVVKTYITCKYSKEVVEAEKDRKSDSLASYMFRKDNR